MIAWLRFAASFKSCTAPELSCAPATAAQNSPPQGMLQWRCNHRAILTSANVQDEVLNALQNHE